MMLRNMWTGSPLRHEDPAPRASFSAEVAKRTASVIRKIEGYGPFDRLRFEDILANPRDAAETLHRVFGSFGCLDFAKASALVRERPAEYALEIKFNADEALASIRRTR
jgi:hypothetical protein